MALAVWDSLRSSPLSLAPGGSYPSLAHSRTSSLLLKKKGNSVDVGCFVHPHSCCYLRISRSRIAITEPQTGGTTAASKRHGGWGMFGGPPCCSSSRILAPTSPTFTVSDVDVKTKDKLPPLPDKRVLGGVGTVALDFLASVASFPDPDTKVRSLNSLAQGGRNVGNGLTAAARLGRRPRIFSKLANDAAGIGMLKDFESNGVDIPHIVVRKKERHLMIAGGLDYQQTIVKSGQGRSSSLVPCGLCNSTWGRTKVPIVRKEVEASADRLGVLDVDPDLIPYKEHLLYRFREFKARKEAIEKFEGGLEDFSLGYKRFGFTREKDAIMYREWVPAAKEAQLVGDFNGWKGANHKMEKNEFGVWSIRLPDVNGKSAIEHGSKVKIRLRKSDGSWADCISAWIKWAVVHPHQFAAAYDGIYWDPPASKRYNFKHRSPLQPAAPRIYEAHVGMSSTEARVNSYRDFADSVLPRIKANNYNTIQLMAVMEHAYYGCFGYHVTNFFAVSSRSGTPEDLKYLIDKAHSLGIRVLMDMVHSHASTNMLDGLNGFDLEPGKAGSYFHSGSRGYHKLWDSRLFNYGSWEVQRFLLSNLRWWVEEYHFDGFRFDGVTSMLYHHHGLNMGFSGNYREYFSPSTDVEAGVYLMLANDLIHGLNPEATMIAEDVSGMPTLGRPVSEGGFGFDYRLAMAIPDKWIQYLKERKDEDWQMGDITYTLLNRRYTEKCVGYAESHDQVTGMFLSYIKQSLTPSRKNVMKSMVGDKTFAFLLMDKDMYFNMSAIGPASPVVDRGVALHKMIHFITFALGGEGYLNFMGNEFGHPEWIDFPRAGNNWSFDKCRRRWDLADMEHLRYKFMNRFDQEMNALDERFGILNSRKQYTSCANEGDKMIVFEKADLVFIFNFHPSKSYEGYKVGCELPGKYKVVLDSDTAELGGHSRIDHMVDHFTSPEGTPGKPETNFNKRPHSFFVLSPSRSVQVYYRAPEKGI